MSYVVLIRDEAARAPRALRPPGGEAAFASLRMAIDTAAQRDDLHAVRRLPNGSRQPLRPAWPVRVIDPESELLGLDGRVLSVLGLEEDATSLVEIVLDDGQPHRMLLRRDQLASLATPP